MVSISCGQAVTPQSSAEAFFYESERHSVSGGRTISLIERSVKKMYTELACVR